MARCGKIECHILSCNDSTIILQNNLILLLLLSLIAALESSKGMSESTTSVLTVTGLPTKHTGSSYSPSNFNFVPSSNLGNLMFLHVSRLSQDHFPSVNKGNCGTKYFHKECFCMHYQRFLSLSQTDWLHFCDKLWIGRENVKAGYKIPTRAKDTCIKTSEFMDETTYKEHGYIGNRSDIVQIVPFWKECKCLTLPMLI